MSPLWRIPCFQILLAKKISHKHKCSNQISQYQHYEGTYCICLQDCRLPTYRPSTWCYNHMKNLHCYWTLTLFSRCASQSFSFDLHFLVHSKHSNNCRSILTFALFFCNDVIDWKKDPFFFFSLQKVQMAVTAQFQTVSPISWMIYQKIYQSPIWTPFHFCSFIHIYILTTKRFLCTANLI